MQTLAHYEMIAALFEYPGRDYPARVRSVYDLLESRYPLAAAELGHFVKGLPELDVVQEIFTRSFDVQSITTLGVGYVMFGDDYKRGELLVNLNREHREAGIECGNELPDHLPTVLRLIARWQNRELTVEFVEEILHPALERMIAEFGSGRTEQRNRLYKKHFKTLIATSAERGMMYRAPLAALLAVLREDFDLSEWKPPERENDFLRSIGRELVIEETEGRPAPSRSMP
jgi:nitrate reductase molybdenum cofactor assembly chaperone